MPDSFRAIDTKYRGFVFRSRLEARYAVFFDALGLGFRYEPEGFEFIGHDRYLPDFYLPRLRLWVEVKAQPPTERESRVAEALARARRERVALVIGPPDLPGPHGEWESPSAEVWMPMEVGEWIVTQDLYYWWCECQSCGAIGLEYNGRAARIDCCDENRLRHAAGEDKDYRFGTPRLVGAVHAARAARFDGRDPWAWKVEP